MNRINEAIVKIWGREVGIIVWDDKRKLAAFQYFPNFLNSGLELSPLKMPLSDRIYEFPELRAEELSSTFLGLPGIFADSLPEKYGNTMMREWLRRQGIKFDDLNPIERLCYVGERGMGALEYKPAFELPRSSKIDLDELVDIARTIISDENEKRKDVGESNAIDSIIELSTSAGGAKAKALVALKIVNEKITGIYSGQTAPRKDLVYSILKISDVKNDEHHSDINTGKIEYTYYKMALKSGINMMPCFLVKDSKGVAHFMTQRFDRIDGNKIHMATFCALAHADRNPPGMYGYEDLFDAAHKIGCKQNELLQLYRRMVFNIIARNQDDHSKNHSFLMDQKGKWIISPAYDICFSYNKKSKWIDKQQMCCNGKRDNFVLDDLLAAAKYADVTNPMAVIEEVKEGISAWEKEAEEAELPAHETETIKKHFRMEIGERKQLLVKQAYKENSMKQWYIGNSEKGDKSAEIVFGIFFSRKGFPDGEKGYTSPIQSVTINEQEKEYEVQTVNTLYHCSFDSINFEEQDKSSFVLPEYERIKQEYCHPTGIENTAHEAGGHGEIGS